MRLAFSFMRSCDSLTMAALSCWKSLDLLGRAEATASFGLRPGISSLIFISRVVMPT